MIVYWIEKVWKIVEGMNVVSHMHFTHNTIHFTFTKLTYQIQLSLAEKIAPVCVAE